MTIDMTKPVTGPESAPNVVDEHAVWLRRGWTDAEVDAFTLIRDHAGPAYIAARGKRREESALRVIDLILVDAGLANDDYDAWARGEEPPRLQFDVDLPEGRTLIKLPSGYDDLTDRPRLVARLHERVGTDAQVETIAHCRDGSRSAAVLVRGEPSWRPLARTLAIPDDRRDGDAAAIDAELRRSGETILGWDFAARRQLIGRLAPIDLALRDRIALACKRQAWEIRIACTWAVIDGEGVLDTATLIAAPELAADAEKNAASWLQIARTRVGHEGWTCEVDLIAGTVKMRRGVAIDLPSTVEYPWSVVDAAEWSDLAFGQDGYGRPVSVDLASNPHVLVVGKTGSGKSIALEAFIYSALAHSFDLAIVDPTKRGLDFRWARPYVRDGGWGCQTMSDALETIRLVYAEGKRRLDILDALDLPKWTALSHEQREEHCIRPILLGVDEATSLAKLEVVPRALPQDDPERIEAEDLNLDKQRIMALLGKVARECRYVGVHLVLGTQRFSVQDIGDGAGSLRENLGNRILLGRASSTAVGMAVMDPVDALSAYEQAHGVAASTAESDATLREKRPGRGIVEMDGQPTTAFQGVFADHETLAAKLAERHVRRRTDDGRPRPLAAATPVDSWVSEPEVEVVGELTFSLDDLDDNLIEANASAPHRAMDHGREANPEDRRDRLMKLPPTFDGDGAELPAHPGRAASESTDDEWRLT